MNVIINLIREVVLMFYVEPINDFSLLDVSMYSMTRCLLINLLLFLLSTKTNFDKKTKTFISRNSSTPAIQRTTNTITLTTKQTNKRFISRNSSTPAVQRTTNTITLTVQQNLCRYSIASLEY